MPEEIQAEKKEPELKEGVPSPATGELDEEVAQARDLMNTFVKTIKGFRLYPPENPSLLGFKEQLIKKFQFFLNKYHSLILQIGEYTFSYKEKSLYENNDLKTSLAFLLYKDGMREIRFMEGLEDWEVQGLIDIINRSENINLLEDDIITLTWEKDFVHISYFATDEFLDETPIVIPENIEQFRKGLVFEPLSKDLEVGLMGDEVGGPSWMSRCRPECADKQREP